MKTFHAFLFCCLFLTASCNKIMSRAYGIREPLGSVEALSQKVSSAPLLKKFSNYYFDSSYYDYSGINFSKDSQAHKNAVQPIQLYYFDQNDSLISYHNNCYVGGFPNLRWNEGGSFNVFPPVTRVPLPVKQQYATLKKFMRPLASFIGNPVENPAYRVVLLWNNQLYRQSANLIKLALKNTQNQNVQVELVNTDLIYPYE